MADSIQQLIQDVPFENVSQNNDFGGIGGFTFLLGKTDDEPMYWSSSRDQWLREFYRRVDPIKLAVGTFVSKARTIPVYIYPRDRSVKKHVRDAKFMQDALRKQSGLFRGFKTEFSKFVTDFLTTDNGGHMIVMGGGSADGPILGPASGLYHIDSCRTWRTGNPVYPLVYTSRNGQFYKIHYTRVISMSNLPDGDVLMNDVGLCPVSCCLLAAKEIRDIYTLSSEKMGSRPQRRVLYVEEGATIDQLNSAVQFAETKLDNQGLKMFARTLLLAPKVAGQKLKLGTLDLTNTHDGFDRLDVTLLNMAAVAAAFKLDLQDLAIAFGVAGQNRSTAEVQDRKGRGKGVGELLEAFMDELDLKFLPEHLRSSFDNQDDEQDEGQANIWNIRSQARDRDMTSGITTSRIERMRMLEHNELSEEMFEELELMDGRMPDGTDVILLFYSEDPFGVADLVDVRNVLMLDAFPVQPETPIVKSRSRFFMKRSLERESPDKKKESYFVQRLLEKAGTVPVENTEPLPPDPAMLALEDTKNEALDRIDDAIRMCSTALFNVTNSRLSRFLRWQMAALKKLKSMYEEYMPMPSTMGQDSIISDTQLLSGEPTV